MSKPYLASNIDIFHKKIFKFKKKNAMTILTSKAGAGKNVQIVIHASKAPRCLDDVECGAHVIQICMSNIGQGAH